MREFKGFEHGVDLGGWFSQCDHTKERYDTFVTEADFATIASWGLDHVRLPIDYELVEDAEGNEIPEGYDRIRKALELAGKNHLNVILDLHKTFGYSFDEGYGESGFFDNPALQERFCALWERLAKAFSGYGDALAFELLNEVTKKEYSDTWNKVAAECIARIRKILPEVKILIGGYYNNSIVALKDLDAPADENIVYNFHCYDPLVFTHQGAGWVSSMPADFRLSLDSTYGEMADASDRVCPGTCDLRDFPADEKFGVAYFDKCFADAVRIAEERNVPLYCGEYGVIDLASPEETVRWYRFISECFNKYKIGRAAWNYRQMDFGLSDDRLAGVREELLKLL
ncbi:MAG: glycoside hydrolase family 5 protein [Lachnospiraceae bacterium]|nr:glycoside hydrolase family 5 protein [Lachnospiraceae bacterium]